MSTIGRIFIVLNLLLAGVFFAFSGIYLQRGTDYKQQYETEQGAHAETRDRLEGQLREREEALTSANSSLSALNRQVSDLQANLAEARERNTTLSTQLADMSTDVKKLSSDYATVASKLERAVDDANKAMQLALQYDEARDEALSAKQTAEAALVSANERIGNLEDNLAAANAQIASLSDDVREKDLLIASAQAKMPGLFLVAQPAIDGTVSHVDTTGRLVTVQVTNAAGEAKKGYQLAIYSDGQYKGEATVTDVEGDFLFARVIDAKSPIAVGDKASTVLSR